MGSFLCLSHHHPSNVVHKGSNLEREGENNIQYFLNQIQSMKSVRYSSSSAQLEKNRKISVFKTVCEFVSQLILEVESKNA